MTADFIIVSKPAYIQFECLIAIMKTTSDGVTLRLRITGAKVGRR